MADGTKVMQATLDEHLAEGEQVLGATKCSGKGAVMRAAAGSALGGAVGGAVGASAQLGVQRAVAGGAAAPEGGWASLVPQDQVFWTAVTPGRLVYWNSGVFSSKPKKFRSEIPVAAVARVMLKRGKVMHRLTTTFADGSTAAIDLYKAGSTPDQLWSALQRLLGDRAVEQ